MFSANLDARLEGMDMPGEVRSEMEGAKADLGAAEAPEGVDAGTEARIERAIDESFVAGFRAVMLVSAGLALASALAAALPGRRSEDTVHELRSCLLAGQAVSRPDCRRVSPGMAQGGA